MGYLQSGYKKGFTVVELVAVIVIIGILAAVSIIGYGSWRKQTNTVQVQGDLNSVLAAMESARNFSAGYPTSIPSSSNVSDATTLTYVTGDSKSFCIEAQSKQYSDVRYYFDSAGGKLITAGGCLSGPIYDGKYTAFVYDLDLPGCTGTTIQLPIASPASAPTSSLNWGDGTATTTLTSSLPSHTYGTKGKYTVLYEGSITNIDTSSIASDRRPCLSKVSQWGNGAQPTGLRFEESTNITYVAAPPSSVTSLYHFMWNAKAFNQPLIGTWNTSNVTDIRGAFFGASVFNQSINNWDVADTTSFADLFANATVFNQPLNNWNTGNVTNLWNAFGNASAFNQSLNSWDTSKVTSMGGTFAGATSFNGNISTWNTGNVVDMGNAFNNAKAFNQNLNAWDVSKVTSMSNMFNFAEAFNQPLNSWNVSAVTDMNGMFSDAITFNQSLASWNVSNVTGMSGMFGAARAFNQNINSWNVSKVTSMFRMFRDAIAFNQPLSSWNTANVTNMGQMFQFNSIYSQNISAWNTTKVTDVTNAGRRNGGFVDSSVGTLPDAYLPTFPS